VAVFVIGGGQEFGGAAAVQRLPVRAAVLAGEDAAARHADIEPARFAGIDQDRVEFGAVGRAILLAAGPLPVHWMLVQASNALPAGPAVLGAEQALRRCAGIPDIGFVGMARGQPEDMIDGTAAGRLGEARRRDCFGPALAEIVRAKHRRAEMPGPSGDQQGPPIARIEHRVMDHVTEKMRSLDAESAARVVSVQCEEPLAGRDQQKQPLLQRTGHCDLRMWRVR
jgi:hypothetical protein